MTTVKELIEFLQKLPCQDALVVRPGDPNRLNTFEDIDLDSDAFWVVESENLAIGKFYYYYDGNKSIDLIDAYLAYCI